MRAALNFTNGELVFWKETLAFTTKWACEHLDEPWMAWIQDKATLKTVARMAAEPVWAAEFYDNIVTGQIPDAIKAGVVSRDKNGRNPKHHEIHKFADMYSRYPNFFPALLHHLRCLWADLENSKFGRLKKFVALAFAVDPRQKGENGEIRYVRLPGPYQPGKTLLTADQMATAFQNVRHETVNKALVQKAREWVHNRLAAAEQLDRSFFDSQGLLKMNSGFPAKGAL
jgi:hypothetical protein